MSLLDGDSGVLGRLTGRKLDGGDPEDSVRAVKSEWLLRGPFAAETVPVYHDRPSCPIARGTERIANIERQEARKHSVPCYICVVPGPPDQSGLRSATDVVEAMGDRAPETAVRAAARERMDHETADGEVTEDDEDGA
jgi:hypothetical protein